jgi:hypothetical protein
MAHLQPFESVLPAADCLLPTVVCGQRGASIARVSSNIYDLRFTIHGRYEVQK